MTRTVRLIAFGALVAMVGCADTETETIEVATEETAATPAPEPSMPTTPAVGSLLNANDASPADLVGASIDSATAAMIVDGRPYNGILALDEVLSGTLDEGAREEIYRTVWIPINLNTASEEEILLIPGLGERMLHEFEEYRPYRAMDEFRREIGKYVDENEVARLEQYVTLD